MDVLEIDGASNRGIDEVRELRDTVKYSPASSRFKIYIIDEVHMLTKEAFNALLKTLEEPPAHVKFMFATTEPEKVLPTILSRCQRFDLRRIPAALIVQHLRMIAKRRRSTSTTPRFTPSRAGPKAACATPNPRWTSSSAFAATEIDEADVLSMFGLTAQSQILALTEAVLAGEAETALRQLDELAKQGKDLGRLVSDLLSHFRNLLIFQVSRGELALIEASEAEAAVLRAQAAAATPETLTRIMEVLTDTEIRLRDAASRKILFEVALLKSMDRASPQASSPCSSACRNCVATRRPASARRRPRRRNLPRDRRRSPQPPRRPSLRRTATWRRCGPRFLNPWAAQAPLRGLICSRPIPCRLPNNSSRSGSIRNLRRPHCAR